MVIFQFANLKYKFTNHHFISPPPKIPIIWIILQMKGAMELTNILVIAWFFKKSTLMVYTNRKVKIDQKICACIHTHTLSLSPSPYEDSW